MEVSALVSCAKKKPRSVNSLDSRMTLLEASSSDLVRLLRSSDSLGAVALQRLC